MNKVIIMGHLGKDAELKYTNGGQAIASFSLATTEKWTDKNGNKQEKTEWHKVNLWGKAAESLAQYLIKGKKVLVEGSIHYREHEGKYYTDIRSSQIHFCGGERTEGGGKRTSSFGSPVTPLPPASGGEVSGEVDSDDIPF